MSAFAALRSPVPLVSLDLSSPLPELAERMALRSTFVPSFRNTIYKPESIICSLRVGEIVLVQGNYNIKVLRGSMAVNNIHRVSCGDSHRIVNNSCESLAVLSCNEKDVDTCCSLETLFVSTADAVVELTNLDNGLMDIGEFYPPLEGHYYSRQSRYSFEIIDDSTATEIPISSVYFDDRSLRSLTKASREWKICVVFGVPTSGKTLVSKTIMNNIIIANGKNVAFLDLDVESSNSTVPGCLSLCVHDTPVFGSLTPTNRVGNSLDLHVYWGHKSFLDQPQRYFDLCRQLIKHYQENISTKGIPLLVRFPSCIKGFGKEILQDVTELLKPDQFVYLTHNKAIELNGYEPDQFESQDNPDAEVLAGFKVVNSVIIIRGTRRSFNISKKELFVRNKLLYFHQTQDNFFEFKPIIDTPPLRISFNYVLGFGVLDYNLDTPSLVGRVDCLAEATIMGLFAYKGDKTTNKSLYLSGEELDGLKTKFICLCIVHSVDHSTKYFNIYLPQGGEVRQSIDTFLQQKFKLVFARGEGSIPTVEMIPTASKSLDLPYIDSTIKKRVGGIWKPRKGIARKNQG